MTKSKHEELLIDLEESEKSILIEYIRELAIIAIEHINNKETIYRGL